MDFDTLAGDIKRWGRELGFQQLGICEADVSDQSERVRRWLARGFAGSMGYLSRNLEARLDPASLLPDTIRVISARMDYLAPDTQPLTVLKDSRRAYVSRYALGRDYHKVLRRRLAKLAARIQETAVGANCRAFTDSAPVLEKALGQKAGLGWIGKHTLLLTRDAGSWFFLGEIYTNLPLPVDAAETEDHCGRCVACINVCPTQAIVGPRQLDARRCISYLTIESHDPIPEDLRRSIGNRVFGCDDCQLVCPWNRYARASAEADFAPRHGLDDATLIDLFLWNEAEFLSHTEGSAIRRINYRQWSRNLAVALGNADYDPLIVAALSARRDGSNRAGSDASGSSEAGGEQMVREHIDWALGEQRRKRAAASAQ
ncbi:MAG: tRNA epoxyqueuosine(34) reductase QueG [Gammaproteobacteria bacterium]|nr:MAG: tRNA epoxyqueuosine(34) reductase QueG [Gammaproteobacteria bacterium]